MAEARLAAILAGDDALVNIAPSHVTFRQACDERLRYVEHDRHRKRSTVNDYRNVIEHDLIPFLGEDTPVEDITTATSTSSASTCSAAALSHRTAQKVLVILHGDHGPREAQGLDRRQPVRRRREGHRAPQRRLQRPERRAGARRRARAAAHAQLRGDVPHRRVHRAPAGRAARAAVAARRLREPHPARPAQPTVRHGEEDTPKSHRAAASRSPTRRSSRSTSSAAASTSPTRTTSCSATRSAST